MKRENSLFFLRPQLLNVLLTVVVLFLPILRERYNNGQYVTYHQPIVVIVDYFQHFQQPRLLLVMAVFILAIYFVVSLAIVGVSKKEVILMNMNAMFKECMKPHALVHSITGAAVALLLLYFIPSLISNLLVLGIVLFATAFVLEFFVNPARK